MKKAETVVAVFLVLFSLIMVREALRLSIWSSIGPGAGFFPFWLVLGVGICAVVIVVQSLRAPRAGDGPFIPPGAWRPLLVAFLPMVAILAMLRYLGIYIGGMLYLTGYMWLVGRHRWPYIAFVSILIPLALFFIFEKWFFLLLPKGILLERLLYGP
ncbi:MAG: tripartite tricarboxylate transporter TctB family protein [bacterium]